MSIPDPEEQRLVLYQGKNRRLFHKPIEEAAFTLLTTVGRGLALGAAAEVAAEQHPQQADQLQSQVAAWFTDWGRRGWIVDLELG